MGGKFAATLKALGLDTGNVGTSGISTAARATKEISVVDAALGSLNTKRATLGAIQNRLESALNEATSYSENLASSASQILDVDYAAESAHDPLPDHAAGWCGSTGTGQGHPPVGYLSSQLTKK